MRRLDIQRMDRKVKWALLFAGLGCIGFLAAAAYKELFAPEWRKYRLEYADLLQEQAQDERGRAIAEHFQVRIEQNVVPELNRTDRCVTCHTGIDDPRMADQPQPFRTHPGTLLKDHPPETYGCTICHRGQGRAVEFADAKAVGHHWDYPLLPKELTQGSCAVCHSSDEVAETGGEILAHGQQLFDSKGCISCHQINGRGGSLGPALDNVGLKVALQMPMANVKGEHTLPQWLKEHFVDPQTVVAGSLMIPPQLSDAENEALTTYMLSLQQVDLPQSYLSPEKHLAAYKQAHPDPLTGKQLYEKYCMACHDTGEIGRYDKFFNRFMPAVRGKTLATVASEEFLSTTIRNGRPGTIMPAWGAQSGGLTEEEISKLQTYLKDDAPKDDRLPAEAIAIAQGKQSIPKGDAVKGKSLYERNCSACHGVDGIGVLAPDLANPALLQSASDGFLYSTIAYGRRNTAMPGFLAADRSGFSGQDVGDLVAHLRQLGQEKKP